MSALSDRELIAAAQRGQVGAFATLIGHYRDVHTRFAVRMLGGYDPADEALQTAFVRAFQSLTKCREPDQFADWLFRLVINECRARALRRAVRERRLTGEVPVVAGAAPPAPSGDAAAMQRLLDQVDPTLREPFILLYVEELTYQRIAALTVSSVQTLERQVDRACAKLRELVPSSPAEAPPSPLGAAMLANEPVPSLAVRVATLLQRPEVLNDSFEDRLMAKLLRAGASSEIASEATAAEPRSAPSASLTPRLSGGTPAPGEPPRLRHLRTNLALGGVATGLALAAFIAGYAARRYRDVRDVERRRPLRPLVVPKIVRRTDTVRVVRSDTVVVARFAFVDAAAHAVAVVGDFNDWNANAAPLEPGLSKGSWATSLSLAPGRYEYAFLVDGKRWASDRFVRARHEELGVESSVLSLGGAGAVPKSSAARARLKKVLPRDVADRVLAKLGGAGEQGLPIGALEQRALGFAARHVPAKDIEHAIAANVDRMTRAKQLLAGAGRAAPSDGEITAAAEVLRRGGDSATVVGLTKPVPARRSVAVPLEVVAELVGSGMAPADAIERVVTRVHNGAPDLALENWADETVVRLAASRPKEKGKATTVAKHGATTDVHQAGSTKTSQEPTRAKRKTTSTKGRP
jgi:RNA polymerase sigma-70 factor (ECF subfamily)